MHAWTLKLTASLLTGLATVGSAVYVTSHLKSAGAPLHPPGAPGGGPPYLVSPAEFLPYVDFRRRRS